MLDGYNPPPEYVPHHYQQHECCVSGGGERLYFQDVVKSKGWVHKMTRYTEHAFSDTERVLCISR
jgi:hypothetical protein